MSSFLNELGTVLITMFFHGVIFWLVCKSDTNLGCAYLAFILLKAFQEYSKILRYKAAMKKLGAIKLKDDK